MMKTRDRILHNSLELFNQFGEPNVTTLQIADEVEISPGNLYYHFKNKAEILTELFDAFEQQLSHLLDVPNVTISVEDQWLFLHLIFEGISKHRFLYKDLVNILHRYEKIRNRFSKILRKKIIASRTICNSLREQSLIIATDEQLDALCENIVLTITYWPSFEIVRNGNEKEELDLEKGVYQVMSLVAPYLQEEERNSLMSMSHDYIA